MPSFSLVTAGESRWWIFSGLQGGEERRSRSGGEKEQRREGAGSKGEEEQEADEQLNKIRWQEAGEKMKRLKIKGTMSRDHCQE